MAWRAGAPIANMEFFQFHPTCLYHPRAKTFLITEACRGEGGILPLGRRGLHGRATIRWPTWPPRRGRPRHRQRAQAHRRRLHVVLDMTHLDPDFLDERFPRSTQTLPRNSASTCTTQPIPVVPAAHYCCGGVDSTPTGAPRSRGSGGRRDRPYGAARRQPPRLELAPRGPGLRPPGRGRRRRRSDRGGRHGAPNVPGLGPAAWPQPRREGRGLPELGRDSAASCGTTSASCAATSASEGQRGGSRSSRTRSASTTGSTS
jgi:hypothetical protein